MLLPIPEPWQTLINYLSVALCLLTVWLLIRGRRNQKAPEKKQNLNISRSQDTNFKGDMHLALLNQELNRSFSSLTEMLEKQHQFLSSLITDAEPGLSVPAQASPLSSNKDGQGNASIDNTRVDVHQRAMVLYQQGVDPQEISAQLKIPLGEIELIIKMASVETFDPDPSATS